MNRPRAVGFDPSNAGSSSNSSSSFNNNQKSTNHWKDIVNQYERRNASLEQRQAQLSERLRTMECALPSMLMSAMVSMHYGTEPPKMDLESVLSKSGVRNDDGFQVELVYKRTENPVDPNPAMKTSMQNSARFATGDDGRLNKESTDGNEPASTNSLANLSVMSSRDLQALGRIQELAEQERLLKRYICDLESRERTFCETLEKTNRLLNDPLECVQECIPACSGSQPREPLSDDPMMQRLQKLEFYNKKMILGMKGLRQEKNFLIKQTELLKTQLRNTQEKLGEVQKEVLGPAKVIPVMGEASFTEVHGACSCASTTNKENSVGNSASPKTLIDLAEQFEDVLQKAKNRGLCKLSGTIKDAATKLKELSKSEEGYKCICNCPCDPIFKQDGPCPNCKCGKFDADKLGETGDWFCDSCGGECICDLISLDEDSLGTNPGKTKGCKCGCEDDKIACECGCGILNINEVGEAGDIPQTVARKLSEDLKDIICKDCGNCKCGDDHSNCPDCIEACTCSCTTNTVTKMQSGGKEMEPQDPDALGPRCACNNSDGVWKPQNNVAEELKNKFVIPSGKRGDSDLHPCFECEQPEPCDICFEEELSRLERPKTFPRFGRQQLISLASVPCKECLKFGTKSNKSGVKTSAMCNLCQLRDTAMFQGKKTKEIKTQDQRTEDKTEPQKLHDSNCPCSCNSTVSSSIDCLCGCGVTVKVNDEKDEDHCPCGCGQVVMLSDTNIRQCDCECAKGGVHCDYCCCVESVLEILGADKTAVNKSPETCPCIKDSIREAEMERLAKMLQQDVDCVGKKNNVLRQLVAHCACAAPEIIENSCPIEGCPYHDPAPIRPTVSGLQAAIDLLRVKSRSKDGMIAVLAENLGGRVDAGKIIEKLATPTLEDISQDFDQCRLYNYLKGSELSQDIMPSGYEYLPAKVEGAQSSGKLAVDTTDLTTAWSESVIPAPRDFKVVRQICNDCLLVTWTPPNDISTLNGYEILVNGYLANRIRSPTRTEALLVSLDTSRPVMLTLYSLGPGGSSSNPVRITYPVCPCVNDYS